MFSVLFCKFHLHADGSASLLKMSFRDVYDCHIVVSYRFQMLGLAKCIFVLVKMSEFKYCAAKISKCDPQCNQAAMEQENAGLTPAE